MARSEKTRKTNLNSARKIVLKVGLTLFIVYHLYAVMLVPNSAGSYLGGRSAFLIEPYLNFFEFVTCWGFFAPDPGPPPIFVEWELEGESGQTLSKGHFPDYPDPYFLRERQNRRSVIVRFMSLDDTRSEKMLAPYLCEQNPKAVSVSLWRTYYNLPTLEDAVRGMPIVPFDGPGSRQLMSHSFCKESRS